MNIKKIVVWAFIYIGGLLVILFVFGNPLGFLVGGLLFLSGLGLSIPWKIKTLQDQGHSDNGDED